MRRAEGLLFVYRGVERLRTLMFRSARTAAEACRVLVDLALDAGGQGWEYLAWTRSLIRRRASRSSSTANKSVREFGSSVCWDLEAFRRWDIKAPGIEESAQQRFSASLPGTAPDDIGRSGIVLGGRGRPG